MNENVKITLNRDSKRNEAAVTKTTDMPTSIEARIRASLSKPIISDDVINPVDILHEVLADVGIDTEVCGASVSFTGRDPILKSPWPLATMGGVALMAKAVAAAGLWYHRTGEKQDISL